MTKRCAIAILLILSVFWPVSSMASGDFANWLKKLQQDALQKGISQKTVNLALTHIEPIPRVIELDQKQPEGHLTFEEYKQKTITQDRIDEGRRLFQQHRSELNKASAAYGVQPEYLVALWGIETSYGKNTGGFNVIPALATLAYDGRRSDFFRGELMIALKILDEGHIDLAEMQGSWAGAMGQNQFMPSSFMAFAVDGNNDGRRNIWTSLPDVFASTANYLSKSGWDGRQKWGREVILPAKFSASQTGFDAQPRTLNEWRKSGVIIVDTEVVSPTNDRGWIIRPDGITGPAFLVYDNYRVIMKWNKSTYFATSVGILADRIAKADETRQTRTEDR